MNTERSLRALIIGILGAMCLFPSNAPCQKQCLAKPYDFSKDAPKSINDECEKDKKKYIEMLKQWNPKALQDPSVLERAGLKIESFWDGYLGPESVKYQIIFYSCYNLGFLTVFKLRPSMEKALLWQSHDISSEGGSITEVEDLNEDGNKEIFFWRTGGSGGGRLDLYSWTGDSLYLIDQFLGSAEFKDLDGDGVKEIVEYGRPYGDGFSTNYFYKWDGKTYKLYKTEKIPVSPHEK